MLIILAGSFAFTQGYSQYSEDKEVYYICFDNSASLKKYRSYQRMMGILISYLKREGVYDTIEIKYIPFGTNHPVQVFHQYTDFSNYIRKNTYSTTNFDRLSDFLDRVNETDQVIVISDGENDISTNAPFTHLTITELEQMQEIAAKMNRKNLRVYSIHILKEYNHILQFLDLEKYFRELWKQQKTKEEDGEIIAKLTKDFMKKMASGRRCYYPCGDNKDALKALFDIFAVPLPADCNASQFKITIPMAVHFDQVNKNTREWFWQELKNTDFCIRGIQRRLQKDQKSKDFKLEIKWISSDVYTVKLGNKTILDTHTIRGQADMNQCINRINKGIEEKIKEQFYDNPRYTPPVCLISVKFLDEKLYAFLTGNNFQLGIHSCNKKERSWRNADVSFFDEDKRVYIPVPMIISDQMRITLPVHHGNEPQTGKLIPLGPGIGNLDAEEITIYEGDIAYPGFSYDFSDFFSKNKGTLLFFSANTKRFFGMMESSQKSFLFKFFKNQRYKIYFVPRDIEKNNIKSISRNLGIMDDTRKALELLLPTRVDVVFNDWEQCLVKFKIAAGSTEEGINRKEIITRQIAKSNGYFLLLAHLAEIMENDEYKQLFEKIITKTIEIYQGLDSPFFVIDLLRVKIPGFSHGLRQRFLALGRPGKMHIVFQVLSNPITNLTDLKYYMNGELEKVSRQNLKFFKELEG